VAVEQGWRVEWLLEQRAMRLSFRSQTPCFDHHKLQGDKYRHLKHKCECCQSISECGEDRFGLKLDSSR
jgi:hypothetical protein